MKQLTIINRIKSRGAVLALTVMSIAVFSLNTELAFAQADMNNLKKWQLAEIPPFTKGNEPTLNRIHLGKMLFFDTRLSGTKKMSCASCHDPEQGWSDGLATSIGRNDKVLQRSSPSITNTVYNTIFTWDGSEATLESQASAPLDSIDEMHKDFNELSRELNDIGGYQTAFANAYPGEGINKSTITKAIATFEGTITCTNSPFDQYIKGDTTALNKQQKLGFAIFTDTEKGNCVTCHMAPNFSDDGFHNVGLKSYGQKNHDIGRYKIKPVRILDGAFKTPSLRNVEFSAPYFHDGSAKSLEEVVDYYVEGGAVKTNLSPDMEDLNLSTIEKESLVSFLKALSCKKTSFITPKLPI